MKDWRIIHRQMADKLRSKGWQLIAEGAEQKPYRREWPVGTLFFWAIQEAWSPPA